MQYKYLEFVHCILCNLSGLIVLTEGNIRSRSAIILNAAFHDLQVHVRVSSSYIFSPLASSASFNSQLSSLHFS